MAIMVGIDLGPQEVHAGDGISHCAAGCGRSLEGKKPTARFCSNECRVSHWKEQNESPEAKRRRLDREAKRAARAKGPIRSDIRVSFDKALETVAHRMWLNGFPGFTKEQAEAQAWWALRDALPERLREHV